MNISKTLLLIAITFSLNFKSQSQISRGFVKEGLTVKSEILKKDVRYTIYLPYDYKTSNRYYPVVYLLHGYSDNDTGWLQFGGVQTTADEAIANGEIPPMIIIMPDAGVSWYINSFDNSVRYEDFFFEEFIPKMESDYRIRPEKQYRGVAGLSMGGYGSLVYILKHPDKFAACVAFSAAIQTEQEYIESDWWEEAFAILYGKGLEGKERITEHLQANDPFNIVKNTDIEEFKNTGIYLDCGDDDGLSKANASFHILLQDLKVPHEYRVRDGKHSWKYWRTGLTDGLKFIGAKFRR